MPPSPGDADKGARDYASRPPTSTEFLPFLLLPGPRECGLIALVKGRPVLDKARAVQLIKAAKPLADADTAAALAPFAPAVLAELAGSSDPWAVRRVAIRALTGRVDDAVAATLLERALDAREVEGVRSEALDVLAAAGRAEILGALRRLRAELEAMETPPYGLPEVVISTAARLGDLDVAVGALSLRYDPWSHRRRRGEEAVKALEEKVGIESLARAFGGAGGTTGTFADLAALARSHPEPVVRRWAVDVAPVDAPWLPAALGDPEWVVAEGAHAALLRCTSVVEEPLRLLASDPVAPPVVRGRAILALLRRGLREEAKELWEGFAERHIALPGIPSVVRRTVLHCYLPGERGTDPRWLLEGELDQGIDLDIEREGGPDEPADVILEAARQALKQAGCPAGEATPIGTVHQQGGGTYVHLQVAGGFIEVSELGRFISAELTLPDGARESLEQAGFLFVEAPLATQVFEGLGVYFFGRRNALDVYDLLFYWQD